MTALFRRLGCRDYARFDFRADGEGRIKLLEVNPNPGWCWDGKLAIMARFRRISYSVMLHMILAATRARLSISADSALPAGPQARPGSLSARI